MRTALALAAALLLPATVAARPALSLRLAWAPALGGAAARVPIDDALRAQLPLQVDALWTFGGLAVGPYASWGRGIAACDADARCSGAGVRAGVEALQAIPPLARGALLPWVGAGMGWEWASRRRERADNRVTWTWSGPEAHLQLGGAFAVHPRLAVGPYLLVAGGRFTKVALSTPVDSGKAVLQDRAIHAWVHLGVRGTLGL